MAKTKKLIVDECQNGRWVRCWKEKREIIVQVWNGPSPEGEPAGDWAMPGVLGISTAIAQAVLQTPLSE